MFSTVTQRTLAVTHYGIPKEAVGNLLRLPLAPRGRRTLVVRYAYFNRELRHVPIVFSDEPIPRSTTRTPGGFSAACRGVPGPQA